jgi:hypothetical protein
VVIEYEGEALSFSPPADPQYSLKQRNFNKIWCLTIKSSNKKQVRENSEQLKGVP